jgi:hypothetical protein
MGLRLPRANVLVGRLTNANVGTYAQTIINGLTAQPTLYPTPPVDLATFQADLNNYNTALAASIGGSAAERAVMHAYRRILENDIRADGQYVNTTEWARISVGESYADATSNIISSGYQIGTDPSPVGPIPQATIKKFSSPAPGQLYVLIIKLKGAKTYSLIWGITGTDPSTWKTETFPNTRILRPGFQSGQSISFTVQGNGASGITTQSEVQTQIII